MRKIRLGKGPDSRFARHFSEFNGERALALRNVWDGKRDAPVGRHASEAVLLGEPDDRRRLILEIQGNYVERRRWLRK